MRRTVISAMCTAAVFALASSCNKMEESHIASEGNDRTVITAVAEAVGRDIEAFYPAELKTDGGYVWPAIQTNNQTAPMYAKQTISGTGSEIVSFSIRLVKDI